jgi:hypothetical protein
MMKFTPMAATISAMTRVIPLIPVFPKKRLIMRAYQSVRPISKVAIKHAAASSALEIHPGLSLEE